MTRLLCDSWASCFKTDLNPNRGFSSQTFTITTLYRHSPGGDTSPLQLWGIICCTCCLIVIIIITVIMPPPRGHYAVIGVRRPSVRLSVRLMSRTSALTRKPKGLRRRNFAQRYPRSHATTTPTSRSKGQKSKSQGQLVHRSEMCQYFANG